MITQQEAEALGLVSLTDWLLEGRPEFQSQHGRIKNFEWLEAEKERIEGYRGKAHWQQGRRAEIVVHPDWSRERALFVNPMGGPGAPGYVKV